MIQKKAEEMENVVLRFELQLLWGNSSSYDPDH